VTFSLNDNPDDSTISIARLYLYRHLQFAWWSLLCFLTLGIFLEALHGFKVDWYLNSDYQTRRLMWTLGHAHGALLALTHVAFAATVYWIADEASSWLRFASPLLMGASVLLPGGFFLGGTFIYVGDPGLGIFLVPLGALFPFLAVLLTAYGASFSSSCRSKE